MLTVITGPPCSGKSTEAMRRHRDAGRGSILIDYDLIAQALGSTDPHNHPDPVRWVTIAARRAAIDAAIRQHQAGATVWIVQTRISATDTQRYRAAGAQIITLAEDQAELHRRATAERPADWHRLIDQWTPEAPPRGRKRTREATLDADPTYRRGRRGRPYRRWRAAILARSTTCWICGHPGADSADHVEPLVDIVARGGDPLDPDNGAPAHHAPCPTCGRRCNPSRGATSGRGDTQRDTTHGDRGRVTRRDVPGEGNTIIGHAW